MPTFDPFDDDAIDALLAGTARGGDSAGLAAFIDDLRTAAVAVPTPSPALAAAIAAGGISTYQPQVAQWRKLSMKLKGFVAGLGLAGKLALGVGVAAAATTGAGAAGVLPGPVQHAMSNAVSALTPFSMPDSGGHHSSANLAEVVDSTTTTTAGDVTTTTAADKGDDHGGVTPTTERHPETTDSTVVPGGDSHEGDGNGTTPTSEHHDGDHNNPESLSIECVRTASPASITCTWTASTDPGHANYVLLRTGDGSGRVVLNSADALTFTDTSVTAGVEYEYRVDSLRADGSVDSHSRGVGVECCGGTTPTTEHHDNTTTTTEHHSEPTTTTTVH